MSRKILGLDIGSHSKAVLIREAFGKIEPVRFIENRSPMATQGLIKSVFRKDVQSGYRHKFCGR